MRILWKHANKMYGQRIATGWAIVISIGLLWDMHAITQAAVGNTPRTFLLNLENLETMKQGWRNGGDELQSAVARLLVQARAALERGPFSVVDKEQIPPSGDKHDYFELDPKFWPNPDTLDGFPWIQTGERNPDAEVDGRPLGQLGSDVEVLTLAYFLSDNEIYAEHAAFLLRTWFIDDATSMNPNMTYGKVDPNRPEALVNGFPVARAALNFIRILDSAGLLESSSFWTLADQESLQKWAIDFVTWMETHPVGIQEKEARNNHGTFYDLLNALLAIYSDTEISLRSSLLRYQDRMLTQFAPDGSQPIEMERSNNFFYHVFNLTGALLIARLSEHVHDIDLLFHETQAGGSIPSALVFLTPYAIEEEIWPFSMNGQMASNPKSQFLLYHRAASIYNHIAYVRTSLLVPGNFEDNRVKIAYPITHFLLQK